MISSPSQADERHPRVVVDGGEPLQVARGRCAGTGRSSAGSGCARRAWRGRPPARRRRRAGSGAGARCRRPRPRRRPPSAAGSPAPAGRARPPSSASSMRRAPPLGPGLLDRSRRRSVPRVVGIQAVQREDRPPGVEHRGVDPVAHPRSTARSATPTPSVIVGGQRPPGEPGGVADPAGGQRPVAGRRRGPAPWRAGASTTAAPPGTARTRRRRGPATCPRRCSSASSRSSR